MESAAVTSVKVIFNKRRGTADPNQLILICSFINAKRIFGFVTFSKYEITSIRTKSVSFNKVSRELSLKGQASLYRDILDIECTSQFQLKLTIGSLGAVFFFVG